MVHPGIHYSRQVSAKVRLRLSDEYGTAFGSRGKILIDIKLNTFKQIVSLVGRLLIHYIDKTSEI